MLTIDLLRKFLSDVTDLIKADAESKNQKIPVGSFQPEVTASQGLLYAAHYFKYLVHGRGPGKQPPPEAMLKFVQDNPHILEEVRQVYKYINERGLAFLIGRKIGREGTDIYQGKKPGIDLEGAIEGSMEDFLEQLAYHEATTIADKIVKQVA